MTLGKRVKALEHRAARLLTVAELQTLTDAELTAYLHRLDTWNGDTRLSDFQARLEAMPDAELLSVYESFEGSR